MLQTGMVTNRLHNRLQNGSIPPKLMAQPYLHLHTLFCFECWTPGSPLDLKPILYMILVVLFFCSGHSLIETRPGLPELTYDVRMSLHFVHGSGWKGTSPSYFLTCSESL